MASDAPTMQPAPVANAGYENEPRYYEAPFFSPPPYAGGGDTMMMNTCDACNGWGCFMPVHGASSPPCQPIVQRPMGGEVCWYYMHGEYGCLRQDCPFFHPIVTFPPPPPPTPLPFSNESPIVSKPLTDVRVYVGNIPADFAEAYYFRLLEAECGRILLIDFISILYNRRCSAFIHMMRDKDAEALVDQLDGMTLNDGVQLYAHIKMSVQLMPGDRGYSRLASMIGDEAEEDEGEEEESDCEEEDCEEEDCGDASSPAILCLPPQSPLPPLLEVSEKEESPTSVILCAAMKVMTPFGLEKSPYELFVEDSSEC